jgi:uncharacterized protein YcnI
MTRGAAIAASSSSAIREEISSMLRFAAAAAAVLTPLLLATAASAHVTLETSKAPAGGFYKAVLRVPHGCDGAATVAIRVQIPVGVMQTKPMPKPGWQLDTVVKQLDQPYDYDGARITEEVREIAWSGGDLPDAYYDEFVFRAKLPKTPGKVIYFPVVQECTKGVARWIEIPEAGKSADDYETPAPAVMLTKPTGDDD